MSFSNFQMFQVFIDLQNNSQLPCPKQVGGFFFFIVTDIHFKFVAFVCLFSARFGLKSYFSIQLPPKLTQLFLKCMIIIILFSHYHYQNNTIGCCHTSYLSQALQAVPVEKKSVMWRHFSALQMWRNQKFLHMWSNFKFLHMTDVEISDFVLHDSLLWCFRGVLSHFMLFYFGKIFLL